MKNNITTTLLGTATAGILLSASASAASSLLFNYSQKTDNNIATPGEVGVEALVNVTGNAGTQTGSLDGVSYSMTHGDYWQARFVTQLGHPYGAVLEDNVTVSFSGLNAWLLAEGATAYEVTVHYAGEKDQAEYLGTANSVTVDGVQETITLVGNGTAPYDKFWSGDGATHTLTADSFTIRDTETAYKAGISSVRIVAVPEPSSAALLGLGGLALILRRRKI